MKTIIKSQYGASLGMLDAAVSKCGDTLWLDADYEHPFWRVAYHALFFTDLYLSASLEAFTPWAHHVNELESLGPMIHKDGKMPIDGPPYTRDEVCAYGELVLQKVGGAVDDLDPDSESGFFWLPFSKLELQIYNIRHTQHHAGQLIERIRQYQHEPVDWVGKA